MSPREFGSVEEVMAYYCPDQFEREYERAPMDDPEQWGRFLAMKALGGALRKVGNL